MVNYLDVVQAADPVSLLEDLKTSGELVEYFPELAALDMPIPRGYHHKNNWFHSLKVLDNALEREGSKPDYILRTAALLHDVGKPATRKFHNNSVVTFQNHEVVGAKIVRKTLPELFGKDFTSSVSHLVRLHMRAYGFGETEWSDSGVRRLMTDAGDEVQLDRLVTIFYSDLTTKNVRKKARVEAGIARLEEAFDRVKSLDERKALRPAINGNELMGLTGLKPGKELGQMMRYLNTDEGVKLSRDEALDELRNRFPYFFKEVK